MEYLKDSFSVRAAARDSVWCETRGAHETPWLDARGRCVFCGEPVVQKIDENGNTLDSSRKEP